MTIQIIVNGAPREVDASSTLSSLLDELGVSEATVVVERNSEPVSRPDYPATELRDGDRLELVRLVGGG